METTKGKLKLKEIECSSYHGYYLKERTIRQNFLVDLEIEFDLPLKKEINLEDTINYENLVSLITEQMKQSTPLLENLAARINESILNYSSKISSSKISIKKLPLIGQKLGGIIFEISHIQNKHF
ncbi:MAG: dihydroneopterin aldolase [Saprospiraceae bacterium]